MASAPCENPNCSSFGKPHPNCQCYISMATGGQIPEDFELEEQNQDQNQPQVSSIPEGFEPEEQTTSEQGKPIPKGFETQEQAYSTPAQQALTVAEGAVQGVPLVGPLATKAELKLSEMGMPGISAQDINARAETNPIEHGLSKAATAIGTALIPVGAGMRAASLGAAALQGFLTQAGMQASDEMTNYMLGQGDPDHPIGAALFHSGAAGLFGLAGNVLGFKGGEALANLAEKNIGSKLEPFLEGVASAASGKPINQLSEEANVGIKAAGSNFYNGLSSYFIPHISGSLGALEGGIEGYHENGITGAAKGAAQGAVEGAIAGLIGKTVLHRLSGIIGKQAVAPFITKLISSGTAEGIGDAINYASSVGGGLKTLDTGIDTLFKIGSSGGQQRLNELIKTNNDEEKALEDYINNGGFEQNIDTSLQNQNKAIPHMALGGQVQSGKASDKGIFQNPGIANAYPQQNLALTAARSRVSNYLTSLKPDQYPAKLPFDRDPDQTAQKKTYKKAIKLALNPMIILKDVNNGTLDPNDVKHLNSMYPETISLMQNALTKKIIQSNLDKKKPPYHVRQGLSMLLGADLSSDTKPNNIQAAQATFNKPQPSTQPQPKSKGTKALTKTAGNYMTDDQARERRQQKI